VFVADAAYFSTTPRMSSSRMMRYSVPSIFTSVPPYLGKKHPVAHLDLHRHPLALVVELAVAHGDNLALGRLLLGGVGDDDATLGFLLTLQALDQDAIIQRTNFH
jgi:hypothetical protein